MIKDTFLKSEINLHFPYTVDSKVVAGSKRHQRERKTETKQFLTHYHVCGSETGVSHPIVSYSYLFVIILGFCIKVPVPVGRGLESLHG